MWFFEKNAAKKLFHFVDKIFFSKSANMNH